MGRARAENTSRQVTLCSNSLLKNAVVALITVVFYICGRLHECASNRFSRPLKMIGFLVMTIILVLIMAETAASSSTYWAFHCAAGNFTPGSLYGYNLEKVAAVMPTRVGSSPLLFANESITSCGGGEVYALAHCWRRTRRSVCERCVAAAFKDAEALCQYREGAAVFRDRCTIAFYNKKIQRFPDDPSMGITATRLDRTQVVIQRSEFEGAVEKLQEAVLRETAMLPSAHFTIGQMEVKTIDFEVTVYAAAECLPTMSQQECTVCLRELQEQMELSVPDMTPGMVASVWCSYRFSLYRFFTGQPTLTLPEAEPPMGAAQPPTSEHRNEHSISFWVWLAAGMGTTTIIVLVIWVMVLCYQKRRLQRQNLPSGERENTVQLQDRTGEEAPSGQVESQPSALDKFENIMEMAKKKKEVTIFLDYDGTLAPIVRDPEKAYMSNEMRGVLQNVANLFRTSIVSGRAREKLFDFVRIKNINYIGSHGMDIMIETSTTEFASTSLTAERKSYKPAEQYIDLINEVHNLLVHATGQINGAKIEHNKYCVSLHYRNVAKKDLPRVRRIKDEMLENMKDQIKFGEGHEVYEFHPLIDWNKGDAVLYVLKELGLEEDSFAIYIGDDRTDEDAFKVIRQRNSGDRSNNGFGILVAENGKETAAYYSLKNPAHVMEFLHKLVTWKQEEKNN